MGGRLSRRVEVFSPEVNSNHPYTYPPREGTERLCLQVNKLCFLFIHKQVSSISLITIIWDQGSLRLVILNISYLVISVTLTT